MARPDLLTLPFLSLPFPSPTAIARPQVAHPVTNEMKETHSLVNHRDGSAVETASMKKARQKAEKAAKKAATAA